MMRWTRAAIAAGFVFVVLAALTPRGAGAPGGCTDPLPIDPQAVLTGMGWKSYQGAQQFGPVCSARWETKSGTTVSLLIYGPTALQSLGVPTASAKAAADRYKGEAPKGVQTVPGVKNVYTVFDPKTPNRRVFVQYRGKVYMINITGEKIPVSVLVKALLRS